MALFPFLQNKLIFYPEKTIDILPDYLGLEYEDVNLRTSDGQSIHGWFIQPFPKGSKPRSWMLFLHGNAGNISHRLDNLAGLARLNLAVFIIDYRGFGHSTGRPTENGVYIDSRCALDYLSNRPDVDSNKIVIFGRSLGGAAAVDLAAWCHENAFPIQGLILESTFTSMRDMARVLFPIVPRGLVAPMFESASKIDGLPYPALFVHGLQDELIPESQGRALYDAYRGPKDYYSIPRAGHNDTFIVGGDEYYLRLNAFLDRLTENPI